MGSVDSHAEKGPEPSSSPDFGSSSSHYGRILLVEDDVQLASLTARFLTQSGYEVTIEDDGIAAGRRILAEQPDLVVLDIMLPGQDGLAVCRQVRSSYHGPIVLLTARDQTLDEILGLEVGADDYLAKPVEPQRLLSRVRAHLRREREFSGPRPPVNRDAGAEPGAPMTDMLRVDQGSQCIYCRGQVLKLSQPEYDLLALLVSRPGHVFSRNEISQALRGIDYDGYSRQIDIMISSLRASIGVPEVIKTVRNKGYLLVSHWPDGGTAA